MWHGQYGMGISYEAFRVWDASQKSERAIVLGFINGSGGYRGSIMYQYD